MSNCPADAIQGAQGWLLFYAWLIGLPVAATLATVLFDMLGVSAGWLLGTVSVLASYVWIVASVWLAYGVLWLGLSVPGLRFVLSRATLIRLYRRYRGPGPKREAD